VVLALKEKFGPPYQFPAGAPDVIAAARLLGGTQVLGNGIIQSENWVSGTDGWRILGSGNAEFNSGSFTGSLEATAINVPDTTTVNSWHVDSTGRMWSGATTYAGATFKVDNDGAATASNLTLTGTSAVPGDLITAGSTISAGVVNITNISGSNVNTGTIGSGTVVLDAGYVTQGTLPAARIGTNALGMSQIELDMGLVTGQYMESTTFTGGSAGWQIKADGTAEFDNVTVRGNIASSTFGDVAAEHWDFGANASSVLFKDAGLTPAQRGVLGFAGASYSNGLFLAGTSAGGTLPLSAPALLFETDGDAFLYGGVGNDLYLGGLTLGVSGRSNTIYMQSLNGVIFYDSAFKIAQIHSGNTHATLDHGVVKVFSEHATDGGKIILEGGTDVGTQDGWLDTVVSGSATSFRVRNAAGVEFLSVGLEADSKLKVSSGGVNEGGQLNLMRGSAGGHDVEFDQWYDGTTNDYLRVLSAGSIMFRARLDSTVYALAVSGRDVIINSSGTIGTALSSRRYKEEIRNYVEYPWKAMMKVSPVTFEYKKSHLDTPSYDRHFGMIAEDLAKDFPHLVHYDDDGVTPHSINYKLIGVELWGLVQDLNTRVQDLNTRLTALEAA